MTNIRITALTNIGNNIAYSSLIPVVDMAGTPTTKKANLQIVGNLILSGAGGTYFAPAARAILAQSITNAAQPNITSVGTLSNLNVSGNVGVSNVNVTGTVYTSGISATGFTSLTTLNVSTTANLGAVGNVTITGGTNGQVLTTNGTGGLSWTTVSGGGSYGNSNVSNYLPTFTGTVGANTIRSTASSGSNVQINANGAVFTFGQGGALQWPAPGGALWAIEPNIDDEFEIRSTSNVVISTDINNANAHFTFASDGTVYCPANANFEGTRLNVGPGAANVPLATNPTLVVTDSGLEFIQAALLNQSSNGSSDYAVYGADSDETQGFADLGFAGHTFNDPNYTVTNPGDGYVLAQGYANGIGGGLVLATGENGNVPDIVFATGGFLANAEFARIDHTNNMFHLTRANSGIKFDDGSIQTTAYTGGVGSELVNGENSFVLSTSGNVVFEGDVAGNAVNRGMVWDYGANANGVNSTILQDINGLSVRAWTENAGNYSAPVNIVTNQDANTKTWKFDGQGNLSLPGNINAINDGGDLGAYITLNPDLGLARLAGRTAQSSVNYTSTSWTSATYTGTQINIVDAPQLVIFFTENQFNVGVNQTISINGDEPVLFTGYTIGTGNDVIVYTDIAADPDPTTVTSIDFYYQLESYVAVDYDAGALNVNATGLTINIDNDQTSGPDINIRSGDDITLQAKDKALGSESEGGDINILAGDGADDDGQGNTASTGGDIQITAGNGGDGNSGSGSAGGFTQIYGGTGGTAGVTNTAGPGGYVSINGGDGGYDNGNTSLGAGGGYVSIAAGLSTQEGVVGPNVTITSGQGGPNALAGSVVISTPASVGEPGGDWVFDGYGNLTLPGNTFAVNYANGTAVSIGAAALGNVTFDNVTVQGVNGLNLSAGSDFTANLAYLQVRAGDVASHIHLDTGNNQAYDLIVGDDQNYVQVSSTGNILLSSYDSNTAQYTWTLDYNGNLILAGGNSVIQSIANSSLDILNPNVSTMVLTPDANYSSQALVLDPTSIGHIHLRSPGSNIDQPSANLFLGGEASSFEVGQFNGAVPNLFIHSNNNTWTFDIDGNLTLPQLTTISDESGIGTTLTVGVPPTVIVISGADFSAVNTTYTKTSAATPTWEPAGYNPATDPYIEFSGGEYGIFAPSFGQAIYVNTGTLNKPLTQWNTNPPLGSVAPTAVYTYGASGPDWVFGDDGNLTLPGNLVYIGASPAPRISGFSSVSALAFTNGTSNVTVNANSNLWNFDSTGNLTIPGTSGGFIKTASNASIGIAAVDNGTNNPAQLLSLNAGTGAATSIVSAYATNVAIQTNAAGAINTWTFGSTGNLILPGNTVAINFANGSAAFGNIVAWTTAPLANTSAGTAGQAAYDSGGNLYVCVATNTWSKFSGTTSW